MNDQSYKALLITNSTFPEDRHNLPDLEGPRNDAAVLRDALSHPGFGLFEKANIRMVVERPAADILREIETFLQRAASRDTVLLYYSGHGRLDQWNELHWCARDTNVDLIDSTTVSAAWVSRAIDRSAAGRTIIVLDCCHSGAFKSGEASATLAGSGRFVLSSTRAADLALDTDTQNHASVFTGMVAEGLLGAVDDLDHDGLVKLDDLYRYVHRRLAEDRKPIPQKNFAGTGDVPIARRGDHMPLHHHAAPPPKPDPPLPPIPPPPPEPPPKPIAEPEPEPEPIVQSTRRIKFAWWWAAAAVALGAIVLAFVLLRDNGDTTSSDDDPPGEETSGETSPGDNAACAADTCDEEPIGFVLEMADPGDEVEVIVSDPRGVDVDVGRVVVGDDGVVRWTWAAGYPYPIGTYEVQFSNGSESIDRSFEIEPVDGPFSVVQRLAIAIDTSDWGRVVELDKRLFDEFDDAPTDEEGVDRILVQYPRGAERYWVPADLEGDERGDNTILTGAFVQFEDDTTTAFCETWVINTNDESMRSSPLPSDQRTHELDGHRPPADFVEWIEANCRQ